MRQYMIFDTLLDILEDTFAGITPEPGSDLSEMSFRHEWFDLHISVTDIAVRITGITC